MTVSPPPSTGQPPDGRSTPGIPDGSGAASHAAATAPAAGGSVGVRERPNTDDLLRYAAEEAARLLSADGAILYLLDPATGLLRFTHDAGIRAIGPDHWIRSQELPIGVGMFGRAVAERRVAITGDYAADRSFVHGEKTDRFVDEVGIRSLVVAPMVVGETVFGALGTYSAEPDAFSAPQIGLVRALADHAALAMANARLIDELARSQEALARQADVERSLRELGTRISGARDPGAVVQTTIDEALRLLDGGGARIDIVDPEIRLLRGLYSAGDEHIAPEDWPDDPHDTLDTGASGRAVVTGETVIVDDYLTDPTIVHGHGPDTYARTKGIRGVIATPLIGEQGAFGAITVWSTREDAFGPTHARLLETIAGQASVALGRARLTEELNRSREALARRAEEERALREIGSRLGTLGEDPTDVLLRIVHESARLVGAERARLDLLEPLSGASLWAYPAGFPFTDRGEMEPGRDGAPVGIAALAIRMGVPIASDDYLADTRFEHYDGGDQAVKDHDLRSVLAAPVIGEDGLLGVLQAGHRDIGAFGEDELRLIGSLAGLASIAVTNARLVERLDASQGALERTADSERALREIARRMMTTQEPAQLLQDVTEEAARLLGSSGAAIQLLDPASGDVRWTHSAKIDPGLHGELIDHDAVIDGARAAIRSRRVVITADYAADERFPDGARHAAFLERAGIRSVAFAPMVGEATVLGTLVVFAPDAGRFGPEHGDLLAALADLAAIAIHNSELIRELGRSREETARRAETERSLREIAARVTSIRDPETILGLIVDEARRVLGSDGAHLTRISESRTYLRPVVVVGGEDGETADWLRAMQFPIDGGINGLAAGQGRVVWTPNYALDPRIPRDEDDLDVAHRLGLGAMAAAPLRAPGGEVIGTLAVSYRDPGPISGDRLATLQALADHAAIAISNSDLLARLESSEERYRGLVQSSPDLIFEMNGDGVYTFYSDRTEEVIGWRPDELVGHSFSEFVDMSAFPEAGARLAEIAANPGRPSTDRLLLRHKNGRVMPFEVSVVGQVDEEGRLAAIRGVARDIGERERLELELRSSEARYRFLVENAPDVVFSIDAETRFTFLSDTIEQMTGFRPEDLVGDSFVNLISPDTVDIAYDRWAALQADPTQPQVLRLRLLRKDGDGTVPVEVNSIGQLDADGNFAGAHGSTRDIGDRERLEAELRASEERYRSVIQSSPDLIWATNRQGRYVFVSDRVRDLLGWEPEEVLGQPFRDFVSEASVQAANEEWARLAQEPGVTKTQRLDLRHREGHLRPFEVSSVAVVREGEVENVYGIARDVAERERLEHELRASEERYRFLVENSPDVIYATDAQGIITYFSESVERTLGWHPAEIIGRHFRDIVRTADGTPAGHRFGELAKGRPDLTTRMELLAKEGDFRPFEVTAAAMRIDGEFSGVHGSARDVRERERLETELRESEERYRYLVQASPDLVWMTDARGQFTFVSDQAEQLLGWPPEELIGRSFAELAPQSGTRSALARFRWLQRRPTEVHRSRMQVRARDGRELAMEITGIGMLAADGSFVGAHGAARDVSERDRLERGLRRQAAELASSEERAHLARELHDSVTQALFSMTLISRSIELLLDRDPTAVPAKLASLRDLQREALAEMRALIFELRPGNVEEHGLMQALRTHSASLSGRIGLPVVVEGELTERPSIEVEETLYRIAQEALHNVVKHAGAREVRLDVYRVADGVRLRVVDDGRGFDPTTVPDGHLGLAGMRSRAERLGGTLSVTAAPGRGTTIEVVIPTAVAEPAV